VDLYSSYKKTNWWKINKFFASFSINNTLLVTTTNDLLNQIIYPKEENDRFIIPFLSKEKSLSLFCFLTLYADKLKNKTIIMCEQIHGNKIVYVNQPDAECYSNKIQIGNFVLPYKLFLQTDGIITDCLQDIVIIFTADCIPLFVINNKNKIFGLVHIGRKGLQDGIVESLLRKLSSLQYYSLKDTFFIAGPHICKNCYIVDGKSFSLFDLVYSQLISANVKASQIFNSHICTFHNKKFFSYRRDTSPYRMLSTIIHF